MALLYIHPSSEPWKYYLLSGQYWKKDKEREPQIDRYSYYTCMYVSGCDKNAYNVSSFAAWKIADEKVLRGVISAQRANRQVGRTEKVIWRGRSR